MSPKMKKNFPVKTGPPVPNGTFGREKQARMLETQLRITNYESGARSFISDLSRAANDKNGLAPVFALRDGGWPRFAISLRSP